MSTVSQDDHSRRVFPSAPAAPIEAWHTDPEVGHHEHSAHAVFDAGPLVGVVPTILIRPPCDDLTILQEVDEQGRIEVVPQPVDCDTASEIPSPATVDTTQQGPCSVRGQ